MTEQQQNPPAPAPAAIEPPPATWRDAWQLPVLVVSGALLALGIGAVILARPAVDILPRLDEATKLVEAEKFEDALKILNEDVWPQIENGKLASGDEKRYYLLAARSIYEAAVQRKIQRAENYENVIRSYVRAEELKQRLEPADVERFALSLMALDRLDEAKKRIDTLPSGEQPRRIALIRTLTTRLLAKPIPDQAAATDLVAWLLSEPTLSDKDRVWAMTRQAELRLLGGYREEAIRGMLQQLPRIEESAAEERAELLALLGWGYIEDSKHAEAEKWLTRAESLADGREPLTSKIRLNLARVAESRSDFQAARDLYQKVLDAPGSKRFQREALLGLAENLASLDETEASLEAYSKLADTFRDSRIVSAVDRDWVATSAIARYRTKFEAGDARTAIRFASIAESLFPQGRAPAEVVLAIGESNRKLAENTIAEATGGSSAAAIDDLDPTSRKRAREHFLAAANALRLHATLVAGQNGPGYADSLWSAADSFDRAGDQEKAILLFKQFAGEFPTDPRMAEAKFRLARCHQSRGDLELAAKTYEDLIASRDGAPGEPGSGPFADASYVPLAQTYLATGQPESVAKATQMLKAVVSGSVVGVDSPDFRDALAELGTMFYRNGEPERAIENIDELLRRYPDERGMELAKFRLADSYRLSAANIDKSMAEGMPDEERRNLENARTERLQRAAAGFDQVRRALDAKPKEKRTAVEETYLRNAFFYLADCSFALGDYDGAIRAYTAARDRYPNDPASLVAMIQIVNANLQRGDVKAALTANERAKRFYRGLPPEVWNDPNLPMGKEDWERWLDATDRLAQGETLDHERPE
ncbi:MAG: tetratricopeptide repeat protein [Phycisphaeraceae bacterium]|nr:tetratricopeptide repeat protein [Phycisphaeraceae bacterium]